MPSLCDLEGFRRQLRCQLCPCLIIDRRDVVSALGVDRLIVFSVSDAVVVMFFPGRSNPPAMTRMAERPMRMGMRIRIPNGISTKSSMFWIYLGFRAHLSQSAWGLRISLGEHPVHRTANSIGPGP